VSLIAESLLIRGLQYTVYAMEVAVCVGLVWRGNWRRLKGLCFYAAILFLVDGVARPAALNFFGINSPEFRSFYWLTDVLLALGMFLLIGSLFRRACANQDKLWGLLRVALPLVLLFVLGFSALTLINNYNHLFSQFIVEFAQTLYFACLVLNTLLYVLIQQYAIDDD